MSYLESIKTIVAPGIAGALAVTALLAGPATAQDSDWPEGSAMQVGATEKARLDAAAAALASRNRQLLDLVAEASGAGSAEDEVIAALREQQAGWRRYADQECALIGALSGARGSWQSTKIVQCLANLVEQRIRHTRHAIGCIRRMPADGRAAEQNRCLYQLLPVAIMARP